MPFTGAHPAIIIPLKKYFSRWFSTTGLVIGSISPDFAYFLSPLFTTRISHTVKGIFLFNLPITIILAILLHSFVREQIIRFLPPYLRRRTIILKDADWFKYLYKNWHIFLVSAIIGSTSHLFWDSFTHHYGWFVKHIGVLRRSYDFFGHPLPVARWLQHISTIIGLTVIGLYIKHLAVYKIPQSSKYEWIYFWVSVVAFGILYLIVNQPKDISISTAEPWVARFLGGCMLAITLITGYYKVRQILRPSKS